MQCGFKYAFFNELKNKLLFEGEVQKSLLVVDKSHVQNSQLYLVLDAIFEFFAFMALGKLRYDIYKAENAII